MPVTDDRYDLQRFVDAQDVGGTYSAAVREVGTGLKLSHWMWFVFPQIAGLGRSSTAARFAITGRAESQAYLAHPVLGARLRECATVLAELPETDPVTVFGPVDAQKLRSSMTLFTLAAPDEPVFRQVLERYFGGALDELTIAELARRPE